MHKLRTPFRRCLRLLPAMVLLALAANLLPLATALADEGQRPWSALDEDTYGRTPEQILAMGYDAWWEFYNAQAGDSTLANSMAGAIYAEAARRRNEGLDPGYYSAALRQLMYDFGGTVLNIGPNLSGGGTIWTSIGASMAPNAEDVTFALRGGSQPAAPSMTSGAVDRQLGELSALVERVSADADAASYFRPEDARADLAALRVQFSAITALAAGLPRADSDRVLAFCSDWISVVTDYGL